MDRQQMIDKIYEKIADKTLSFGCKIIVQQQDEYGDDIHDVLCRGDEQDIVVVIGHPVMIGDVLDWWSHNGPTQCCGYCDIPDMDDVTHDIVIKWERPRKPLEDQTDYCVEYIYSLLSD